MKNAPMMTEYSAGVKVPKSDPRIARRAALDALTAEAWLLYLELLETNSNAGNYERNNILCEIRQELAKCVDIDARGHVSNLQATHEGWAMRMRRLCEKTVRKHFRDAPPSIAAAKVNLFCKHIRQAELLFCYENPSVTDTFIQRTLNDLSAAAYVAVWTGEDE